jgi:hypothetical protein
MNGDAKGTRLGDSRPDGPTFPSSAPSESPTAALAGFKHPQRFDGATRVVKGLVPPVSIA